ncbi:MULTISPECIES: hypothetical protein [unclassified Streptomyces]|uniref:hypothetical protein n=1 Tax=unclassified Streptomyces TaxID=2593676 RepID=UPI0036E0BB95
MTRLPDQQPTAPQAGQPTVDDNARKFLADLESAYNVQRSQFPTSYRDDTDRPAIGSAPPVTQPGRPPMSQRAVDLNATLISTSVVIAVTGGAISAVLCASSMANTTVIAWICVGVVAVPVVLALPVLALKSLMKSAKEVVKAAPPVVHQHYSGHVTQTKTTINADSHGLIAVTRPELPPAR